MSYSHRASLNLSSTVDNVELIYNGLSDQYETLYPYLQDADNEGGLTLLTAEDLGDKQVGHHWGWSNYQRYGIAASISK